jgi:hypothetical protein
MKALTMGADDHEVSMDEIEPLSSPRLRDSRAGASTRRWKVSTFFLATVVVFLLFVIMMSEDVHFFRQSDGGLSKNATSTQLVDRSADGSTGGSATSDGVDGGAQQGKLHASTANEHVSAIYGDEQQYL